MGSADVVCKEEGCIYADVYRLPRVEQGYYKKISIPYQGLMICLIDSGGASVFSKIDLLLEYHQLKVREKEIWPF
jgi:hypothetical protein